MSGNEPGGRDCLKPGIHAIMSLNESLHPSTFRLTNSTKNNDSKPPFGEVNIGLFYWPVDDAFDIVEHNFGNDGIDRSNVSCLYLRTLHEICDCVLIESSMNEVKRCFVGCGLFVEYGVYYIVLQCLCCLAVESFFCFFFCLTFAGSSF